jgi:UV DNA damage repair endonuclease
MHFCVVPCIVCFVSFSVLFVCIRVLNYCHRVATQLQLNISYHINMHLGGRVEHNTAVEALCTNLTYLCKKEILRRCLLSDGPMEFAQH